MSIIGADKIEENQPILINDEDKLTNTSTPKRKARDEQGAPTKKLIVEVDLLNGTKTLNKNIGEEKRAKGNETQENHAKCHSCDERFMKFIQGGAR